MKKLFAFLFVFGVLQAAWSQPTVLFTGLTSTTPSPSNSRYTLNDFGVFRQIRFQANQSVSAESTGWAFHTGTTGSPNYNPCWRPYTGVHTLSSNTFIPITYDNGARYNTGGGVDGYLPAITSGNYYTFNVMENNVSSNQMQLLETTYNPVTITSVSHVLPGSATGTGTITVTTSAAPSAGEYVYMRYSLDTWATSAYLAISFVGNIGTVFLPCDPSPGSPVQYYIFTSNKTSAQINADIATGALDTTNVNNNNGQNAYDLATLNLATNGGANYNYTQPSNTSFSGVYNIPGACYPTLASFVTAINGGTVSGPVSVLIASGFTETAPTGGYNLTATGTSTNTITFQKNGTGANPVFTAFTPQSSGALNDAVFKIVGSDYITLDGLTFQENASNTTTTAASNNMTEWGVALLRTSVTDGSQNNTIKNCTITLNKVYQNSMGIYSNVRHHASSPSNLTAPTTLADISNITGSNSNNKIYTNSISNVNLGIVFIGSGAVAAMDVNNDIGGTSSATGNTITNWGTGSTTASFISVTSLICGIVINHQTSVKVNYNTITSALSANTIGIDGIRSDFTIVAPTGTFTNSISNNIISINSATTTETSRGINNININSTAVPTVTMLINENTISGSFSGVGSSAGFTSILNSFPCGVLEINRNVIRGITSANTSGSYIAISNTGANTISTNIDNNKIGDKTATPSPINFVTFSAAFSGILTGISNSGGASTCDISINNNDIYRVLQTTSAATAPNNYIVNDAASKTLNINNNTISGNATSPTSGTYVGIENTGAVLNTININNNKFGDKAATPTPIGFLTYAVATSGALRVINNTGGGASCALSITGNDIFGITHTIASSSAHTYILNSASTLSQNISSNTFSNLNVNTTGNVTFISNNVAVPTGGTQNINSNSIVTAFNKSGSGNTVKFYFTNAASADTAVINNNNNNFSNITLTGATTLTAWDNTDGNGSVVKNIGNNTFSNIVGGTGAITIMNLNRADNNVNNNIIGKVAGVGPITGGGAITGIAFGANVVKATADTNTIDGLVSSAATLNTVTGISIAGGTTNVINKNVISGLEITGTAAVNSTVAGITTSATGATGSITRNRVYNIKNATTGATNFAAGLIPTGGTWTVANNMFSIINNNTVQTFGVFDTGATGARNYHYNTIVVGGTHAGTQVSAGLQFNAGAGTANITNNIIVMERTSGAKNYAIANQGTSFTGIVLENNILNCTVPATVGIFNSVDRTFVNWQIASAQEKNSYTTVPVSFVDKTVADLHIDTVAMGTAKTHIESGGAVVATTVDFDNETRPSVAVTNGGGQFPDIGADEIDLKPSKCTGSSTWNGSVWSGQTPPTALGKKVLTLAGNFTSSGTLSGCNCEVNSGTIVINANHSMILTNDLKINGGTVTFENNASLVQENSFIDGTSVANTGNIIYKRTATVADARDYVYWSSPVTGSQTLATLYPFATHLYGWSPASGGTNGGVSGNWTAASGTMGLGAGYIIRSGAAGSYTTNFNGVPNNGTVNVTIGRGTNTTPSTPGTNGTAITNLDDNWNLIGNPYPSAIKATDFIAANSSKLSSGTIWLWTHNNPIALGGTQPFYNSFVYNYNGNDYIAHNAAGTSSGGSGAAAFNGNIAAGQSFFVNMVDGITGTDTVSFNNLMRKDSGTGVPYGNSNFYRNSNQNIEKNRIWLDLISNSTNLVSRTLVGYIEGATQGKDFDFDAPSNYDNAQNFYSLIGSDIFTIQSKETPFNVNDTVPLGFIASAAGSHKIGIAEVDGIFATNSFNIYLEDLLNGTIHNLSIAPYQFTTVSGVINNRFILRYTANALSTNTTSYLDNSIIIAKDKQVLKIKSTIENINKVTVFDLLGRKVFEKDGLTDKEFIIFNEIKNEQTLIVKTLLENGVEISKKVIY